MSLFVDNDHYIGMRRGPPIRRIRPWVGGGQNGLEPKWLRKRRRVKGREEAEEEEEEDEEDVEKQEEWGGETT